MSFTFFVVKEPRRNSLIVAQSDNGKFLIAVKGKIKLQSGEYEVSDFFLGEQWKIPYGTLKKLNQNVLAELIHSAEASRLFCTTSSGFELLYLHLLKRLNLKLLKKDSLKTVYRKRKRKRKPQNSDSSPSLF